MRLRAAGVARPCPCGDPIVLGRSMCILPLTEPPPRAFRGEEGDRRSRPLEREADGDDRRKSEGEYDFLLDFRGMMWREGSVKIPFDVFSSC